MMLTIFWDYRGITHLEYMVKGININSENDMMTLNMLNKQFKHVCQTKIQMLLQHDNAKCHTCSATSVMTDSITYETVPCPPHDLDLTPSDFWSFAVLKKHLKRIHFTCDEEVQAAMGTCFQQQPDASYCIVLYLLSVHQIHTRQIPIGY
jgi:transposase